MIDFLLKKLGQKLLYRTIFIIISFFGLFYLVRASQYSVPLGDDGVIYVWPVGKFMAQSSLKEFFIASVSSFLGEDHLSPINNLYGYICYLLSSEPSLILNITTKLMYLFVVISSLIVVFSLWKDSLRLLIFFLFLTFNLSMTWRNMMIPYFNPSIISPLWCLFFMHKFIQNRRRSDLILFSFSFFIITFSFETAFIGIPLLAVYALFSIWNKEGPHTDKIKDIFKIYLLMCFSFLPYMIIHYKLYGAPLPVSRILLVVESSDHLSYLTYYCKMLSIQMSEWLFGIGEVLLGKVPIGKIPIVMFVISPLVILFVYSVYKFKLLSKIGSYLFVAFLFQLLCILYTGRYEHGMWTLVGIIFLIIITDFFYQVISKLGKDNDKNFILKTSYIFVLIAIPFLALVNEIVTQPFKRAELFYNRPYESSQTAYKAINEAADRIVVVRLPDAEPLMHPMAFWTGNKIYHNEPSLWLYPKYYQLLFKNMYIEYYTNKESRPFSYFRPFLVPEPGKKAVVVIKSRNLFSRLFLDSNQQKILRAGVIPYAPRDYFILNLPDLLKYYPGVSQLQYNLTLTGHASEVKAIIYGRKRIKTWNAYDDKISFLTDDLSLDNNLIVQFKSGNNAVELIEVAFPNNSLKGLDAKDIKPKNMITLYTEDAPCRWWISTPIEKDFIVGTLDAQKSITFGTLLPLTKDQSFELSGTTFETNRDKRIVGKINLSNYSENVKFALICATNLR